MRVKVANWRNCLLDVSKCSLKIVLRCSNDLCFIPFVTSWKLFRSHAVTPRWLDDCKELSNQDGANNVTAAPWHTKSQPTMLLVTSKAAFLENYLPVSMDFWWIFDWMARDKASAFQFIWCSIWKPGDSNFWVKICLAIENDISTLASCVKTVNARPTRSPKFAILSRKSFVMSKQF